MSYIFLFTRKLCPGMQGHFRSMLYLYSLNIIIKELLYGRKNKVPFECDIDRCSVLEFSYNGSEEIFWANIEAWVTRDDLSELITYLALDSGITEGRKSSSNISGIR